MPPMTIRHTAATTPRSTPAARTGALFLFAGAPVLGAAAPLAITIAVTRGLGATGWASLALALAIGNASTTVAELGWGVVGPQQVARHPDSRHDLYRSALASKLVALIVIAPLAAVLAFLLAPVDPVGAAVVGAGGAMASLSPAWFFVGAGRPGLTLVCDTLPRLVLSLGAAWLIAGGASLAFYGTALVTSSVVAWILASVIAGLPLVPRARDFTRAPETLRRQAVVVSGRAVSIVYTALPSVALGALAPGAVALYAAVDRPLRMGVVVLGAIPARLQAYLGVVDRRLAQHRARNALLINAGMGVAAALVFGAGMPAVWGVLFADSVPMDAALIALGSLLVAVMCASRGFGIVLVAFDASNDITRAILAAAAVALALVPALSLAAGATGAVVAVIVAEVTALAVQGLCVRRRWRATAPAR
ncbi:O-antigen/teichoic acid export membrane protein [Frondihabitans sp. PhB161]|nr:O-antigen/teichoic acid export membrane protein [Frondihabitans sp. PhB153]RPF08486.1 O-antigen/teichoic acid export membrane protein [Frondihabitans sp. PhB161]